MIDARCLDLDLLTHFKHERTFSNFEFIIIWGQIRVDNPLKKVEIENENKQTKA
jgi:hypothetical protein